MLKNSNFTFFFRDTSNTELLNREKRQLRAPLLRRPSYNWHPHSQYYPYQFPRNYYQIPVRYPQNYYYYHPQVPVQFAQFPQQFPQIVPGVQAPQQVNQQDQSEQLAVEQVEAEAALEDAEQVDEQDQTELEAE